MQAYAAPPSLRRYLMLKLLLPAAALALLLGGGGAFLVRDVVETTHDRLLDGSILAIAERVVVEDDEVNVDLPPVALGMLESQAHDSIYYSISYDGQLITGYRDLPLADITAMTPGRAIHWDQKYRGGKVRIGAQARKIYGKPRPVLIEVAETTNARDQLMWRTYGGLALLEFVLLGTVGLLVWQAVGSGLAPLARLSEQIDGRSLRGAVNLQPLDLSGVPSEALAPATALNSLLVRLDQSIQAVRHFTADASHQMRSPLAVLRTHVQLVRRHGTETHIGQGALDDIDGAVARLERLATQLIALARVDEGSRETGKSEIADLRRIAADIVSDHAPDAVEAGIDIHFDCGEAAIPVIGNPTLIEQIVGNLLDNAIRYNREGGGVTLRIVAEENAVRLEIEDDGPGIPAAEQTRVFDRFYRIPRSGAPSGSGLGLAIVRSVADHLGATIELANREGTSGLVATVRLRSAESFITGD